MLPSQQITTNKKLFCRIGLCMRRNQAEPDQDNEELELFQRHVGDRFSDLDAGSDPFLSIAWLRKLLDLFLCCEAEFKALILVHHDHSILVRPPLDRLVPELLDRTVKALDICNAVAHGIESVRHCQNLAEIAVRALEKRPLGDGQVKRAKIALMSMMTSLTIEDKEAGRSWSFGRRAGPVKDPHHCSFRPSTFGVARSWSAAKQIHGMGSGLAPTRWGETNGLATAVYMMNSINAFAMWALAAAIPCQDRAGLPTACPVPRQFGWAQSMISIHDKIGEEWKRKEKKGSAGLLEEMQKLEKLGTSLIEFAESFHFPASEEQITEVEAQVAELLETCQIMEENLLLLQQQIREVFHRIVRSRNATIEAIDHASKLSISVTS